MSITILSWFFSPFQDSCINAYVHFSIQILCFRPSWLMNLNCPLPFKGLFHYDFGHNMTVVRSGQELVAFPYHLISLFFLLFVCLYICVWVGCSINPFSPATYLFRTWFGLRRANSRSSNALKWFVWISISRSMHGTLVFVW